MSSLVLAYLATYSFAFAGRGRICFRVRRKLKKGVGKKDRPSCANMNREFDDPLQGRQQRFERSFYLVKNNNEAKMRNKAYVEQTVKIESAGGAFPKENSKNQSA